MQPRPVSADHSHARRSEPAKEVEEKQDACERTDEVAVDVAAGRQSQGLTAVALGRVERANGQRHCQAGGVLGHQAG